MNDDVSPVYASQTSSNAPASHPTVFDWSECAITAKNGKTLTVWYPDESKPLDEQAS